MEEIRSLHKPLEKRDLAEHAYKYEKMRLERDQSIKDKRRKEVQAEKERKNSVKVAGNNDKTTE